MEENTGVSQAKATEDALSAFNKATSLYHSCLSFSLFPQILSYLTSPLISHAKQTTRAKRGQHNSSTRFNNKDPFTSGDTVYPSKAPGMKTSRTAS